MRTIATALRLTTKATVGATKLTIGATKLALSVAETPFWAAYGVSRAYCVTRDLVKARSTLHQGILHCPRGHEVPTEGEIYQCQICGFVYQGSIWLCPNPECKAVSPYCTCPTCGLSIRNPYRLG